MRGKISLAGWGALGFVSAVAAQDRAALPNDAIVELVPGASIAEICADYGTFVIADVEEAQLYLLGVPNGMDGDAFEAILEGDPRIADAELNGDSQAPEAVAGDTQPFFFYVPPADYDDQYVRGLLSLEPAHDAATGSGVVVAVLDTSIDETHPVLAGRLLPGISFISGPPLDVGGRGSGSRGRGANGLPAGHGTYVAGIIALVAPDADLLPVTVLDDAGHGRVFATVQGIYHAVEQGADVINLSLSTRSQNHVLRDALAYARAQGVVLVSAVGNGGREHPSPLPASDENVIGVASTDAGDFKADFSNYGTWIVLSAPGAGLVSAMPGDLYASWGGTSASAALVSGAAALILASDQMAGPDQVEWRLAVTAMDLDELNPDYVGKLGAGRLDVGAAVDSGPGPAGRELDALLLLSPALPGRGMTSHSGTGPSGPLPLRGN